MPRLSSFDGINALVPGASSGIGRLLALRLADEGARVALVARRPPRAHLSALDEGRCAVQVLAPRLFRRQLKRRTRPARRGA